jgi:hypothetical protein
VQRKKKDFQKKRKFRKQVNGDGGTEKKKYFLLEKNRLRQKLSTKVG